MVDCNLAIGEDDDVVVDDGLELLGADSPALDLEESALDEGFRSRVMGVLSMSTGTLLSVWAVSSECRVVDAIAIDGLEMLAEGALEEDKILHGSPRSKEKICSYR